MVPDMVIGALLVLGGAVVFLLRGPIHALTTQAEKRVLGGDRAARPLTKHQTPLWVGMVGLSGIALGLAMVVVGVIGLLSQP